MRAFTETTVYENWPAIRTTVYDLCYVDTKPVKAPGTTNSSQWLKTGALLESEKNDKMFVRTIELGRSFKDKETIVRFTKPHTLSTESTVLSELLKQAGWQHNEDTELYAPGDRACAQCPNMFSCKGLSF